MADHGATHPRTARYATFFLGDAAFGIDTRLVREIHKPAGTAPVPLAPPYIDGVLNLRGQIVTIIDLAGRLNMRPSPAGEKKFNIIVSHTGESIGLAVDAVGDVITVDKNRIDAPPANLGGIREKYLTGVFSTRERLVALLDLDSVLEAPWHDE